MEALLVPRRRVSAVFAFGDRTFYRGVRVTATAACEEEAVAAVAEAAAAVVAEEGVRG